MLNVRSQIPPGQMKPFKTSNNHTIFWESNSTFYSVRICIVLWRPFWLWIVQGFQCFNEIVYVYMKPNDQFIVLDYFISCFETCWKNSWKYCEKPVIWRKVSMEACLMRKTIEMKCKPCSKYSISWTNTTKATLFVWSNASMNCLRHVHTALNVTRNYVSVPFSWVGEG